MDPETETGGPTGNRLLDSLPAGVLAAVRRAAEPAHLSTGHMLHERGEVLTTAVFPCGGTVLGTLAVMRDGRTAETATVGCEGVLGALLQARGQAVPGRIVIQAGGPALRLDQLRLAELRAEHPALRERLTAYHLALIGQVLQTAACAALHDVEQRSCRWLLALHDRVGRPELPLTQEFLSEMLGVRRTTVTRVMAGLEARGLIRHRRARILVLDRTGLEVAACECHAEVRARFEAAAPGLYPPPIRQPLACT